jgi:pimeloyl-ACP methyl ester carboxylesterase
MISVSPGVSLHVLDWGGRGRPLVFLAGLGNTAHVFDDFAPQFTDRFHVVGVTRRGFGPSAGTEPANNLDTLVADVVAVLDSLKLDSVVLVGHSIAGEEMTRFAGRYPNRCAGLIYLDAAYDRTGDAVKSLPPSPPPPRMSAEDAVSPKAVLAYTARIMGVMPPESEIRAVTRFDKNGKYVDGLAGEREKARVKQAVRQPRYERVHCRSLAIYAVPESPTDVVPYYAELDAAGRTQADALFGSVKALVAKSRARFAKVPNSEVVGIPGNHYIFLQHPAKVASAMRAFLSSDTSRPLRRPTDVSRDEHSARAGIRLEDQTAP